MSRADVLDPVAPPPKSRLRRWAVRLLLLFVAWAGLMVVLFVTRTDRDLRAALAEIESLEPGGWQVDAIEAARDRVPDEENAALVADRVKRLLPVDWWDAKPEAALSVREAAQLFGEVPARDQPPDELVLALRDGLARGGAALDEARRLIGMTRGRFPLEWQDDVITMKIHCQDARTAADLLRLEAGVLAHDGRADEALARVRGILGAAASVGDEPTLISMLVRLAMRQQAVAALERVLAQGEPSARELAAAQALMEREAAVPLQLWAARGERAGMHLLVGAMKRGEVSVMQINGPPPKSQSVLQRLADRASPALARRSHGRFLRLLTEYVEAAKLPVESQKPAVEVLERKIKQAKIEYDVVPALLMPAVVNAARKYREGVGNLRCAIVAVALERYRRDHGRWPDALGELAPKYLAEVPTDPGDGKPLRYKRVDDGVLVYWVGHDDTDDGGAMNRKNLLAKGTDQGFRLWDVTSRRRPPAELLPAPSEQ